MTVVGFIIILGVFISYLSMLFVLHRFTYKTWIFDVLASAEFRFRAFSMFCPHAAKGDGYFFNSLRSCAPHRSLIPYLH